MSSCTTPPNARPFHGPFLRFHDYDPQANKWSLSALYVIPPSFSHHHTLQLHLDDGPHTTHWQGYVVDTFENHVLMRFNFSTYLAHQQRQLRYRVDLPGHPSNTSFWVPGLSEPLHWGFRSCDWFSGGVDPVPYGGHTPVWNDMLQTHARKPLHVFVGGGDQLYNDPVMDHVPQLQAWQQLSDRRQRASASFTPDMQEACARYYFWHYLEIFGKESIADVYANIPHILIWDDHDIIDGWGSYEPSLQACPVFQGLFQVAKRFYLLFQHHTTEALAATQSGLFGEHAWNFVKYIAPDVAILGADMRANRTIQQIITPANYDAIFSKLNTLHGGVRHVVLVSAVPMAYTELPLSETGLKLLSGMSKENAINTMLGKTGLSQKLMKYDEPELLDDLRDSWCCGVHSKQFAVDRSCRITIISGDVHLAAFGLFYSHPKMGDIKKDPKWMLNATSSASVNPPPPAALVRLLTSTSRATTMSAIRTREKLIRVFANRNPMSDKLLARRNWCSVTAFTGNNAEASSMLFELRAEHEVNPKATSYTPKPFDVFNTSVPPLLIQPTGKHIPPPVVPVPGPMPPPTSSPVGPVESILLDPPNLPYICGAAKFRPTPYTPSGAPVAPDGAAPPLHEAPPSTAAQPGSQYGTAPPGAYPATTSSSQGAYPAASPSTYPAAPPSAYPTAPPSAYPSAPGAYPSAPPNTYPAAPPSAYPAVPGAHPSALSAYPAAPPSSAHPSAPNAYPAALSAYPAALPSAYPAAPPNAYPAAPSAYPPPPPTAPLYQPAYQQAPHGQQQPPTSQPANQQYPNVGGVL